MNFLFFDAADTVLFSRNDAERAEHNHQEMSFYGLFPYDANKVITNGMRVGYLDNLNVYQVFEIIKVKTYEPDHYQEVTAEHICISELTDEIYTEGDLMDITAADALGAILKNTLWQVGNSYDKYNALSPQLTTLNGYIRGSGGSYVGQINTSTVRKTHYIRATGDCTVWLETAQTNSTLLRISDEEPVVGTGNYWNGTLYESVSQENPIPTQASPAAVTKGQYIAVTQYSDVFTLYVTNGDTSSIQLSYGDVWQDVRNIEKNWNVYITPRVEIDDTGITGRYLDIIRAGGTWRGLRFSLEKNLDDAAVTWDTSRLKTALYGYGKKSMTVEGESEKQPWTFASVEWTAEDGHPAKPEGQIYIEDPSATAAYGRDGRPRFGYYQNGDIEDPEKLLELTWETLKTVNAPDVTIEGQVRDITKFGKIDVPIRLHDAALIEITPIGTLLSREIVQYTEDLLQSENSQVTIGKYIPNIVYITKEIASGGGGGGASGGDSELENQIKEFETQIGWNDYQIGLKAWQRDLERTDQNLLLAYAAIGISSDQIQTIVAGSGVQFDPDTGNIVVDSNGLPVFAQGSSQMWSNITQNANKIALVVTANGNINAASIVAAVNSSGSSVAISADKIVLNGNTLVTEISGIEADFANLTAGTTIATALKASTLQASTAFFVGSTQADFRTIKIGNVKSYSVLGSLPAGEQDFDHYHDLTITENNGVVTFETGKAQSTAATPFFNIADTAFYQNAVSAARAAGEASVTMSAGTWTGGSNTITASNGGTLILAAPSIVLDSYQYVSGIQYSVSVDVGGANQTVTFSAQSAYNAGSTAGAASVTLGSPTWGTTIQDETNSYTVTASNGQSVTQQITAALDSTGWAQGKRYALVKADGEQKARVAVYMPSTSSASWTWVNTAQGYWQARCTVGGVTYSDTHRTN